MLSPPVSESHAGRQQAALDDRFNRTCLEPEFANKNQESTNNEIDTFKRKFWNKI